MLLRAMVGLFATLLALSCNRKTPTTGPTAPPSNGGAAAAEATPAGDTVDLRYGPTYPPLRQLTTVEFTSVGGGAYAEASLTLRSELAMETEGAGLKIGWKIVGVDAMTLKGNLEGTPAKGTKGALLELGRGAYMVDTRGARDAAKTAALPENEALTKRVDAAAQELAQARDDGDEEAVLPPAVALLEILPDMLALPALPGEPLEIGRTWERVDSSEIEVAGTGIVLPLETTTRYTLARIDESTGARMAVVDFSVEDWGGVDTDEGPVELSNKREGSLTLDLEARVPVTVSFTSEESLVAGEIDFDTTKIVRTEFQRG